MNNRIEDVVKMAKEVFGDNVDVEVIKVTPNKEEETSKETAEEVKGTPIPDSLITDEEKECITLLVEAFDNLMKLHKKGDRLERLLRADKNDYAMLQYLMYTDHIRDAIRAIKGLDYVCHDMTKEHVDEVAKENDMSVKEMLATGMMNAIKGLLS